MHDYQTPDRGWCGDRKRGAAMGRSSDLPKDAVGPLTIRKVPLDEGGYDPGGTYWGSGPDVPSLFCVSDSEGRVSYIRGKDFAQVKAQFPHATWVTTMSDEDIEDMVTGYAECALWSSCTDDPDYEGEPQNNPGGYPLDADHTTSDIAPETMADMREDCARFVEYNVMTLTALSQVSDIDWSLLGHDFWLSRDGHGAGFGDGDYPDPWDDMLNDACGWRTPFGQVDLYVGDDGKIYSS